MADELYSSIKVSGNIVSELSEKIPSNIVALNELIKNSYDAGASYVKIIINSNTHELKIIDDGEGMNKNDIDTLFHLSRSTKKFGSTNKAYNRYVQGSKGLGFLSVFKFGRVVEWKTKKDIGYRFSVNFDDLLSCDNITDYRVELVNEDNIIKGTEITISLTEDSEELFLQYLNDEKNYAKIVNAFTDSSFLITLDIDGQCYSSQDFEGLKEHYKERQVLYIEYDCKDGAIRYYHNNYLIGETTYPFNCRGFSVKFKLVVYNFKTGRKAKIYKLFYNHVNELTPLIYINNNLFNNFDLFDPSIMKTVKTGDMLIQMIGFVNVYSDSDAIQFNSDRTKFSENKLTNCIVEFLKEINKTIQREGSKLKKYLLDADFLKVSEIKSSEIDLSNKEKLKEQIKSDFYFKDKVTISVGKDSIDYEIFGEKATVKIIDVKHTPVPAYINLKNVGTLKIPSEQIMLKDYIASARNSAGKDIINDITIEINGAEVGNGILESQTNEAIINVSYKYLDQVTGLIRQDLNLKFEKPVAQVIGVKLNNKKLLSIEAAEDYSISFDETLQNLINQINDLPLESNREIITCALRVLFEISCRCLVRTSKVLSLKSLLNQDMEHDISSVVDFCLKDNNRVLSLISISTKISYRSLQNLIIAEDFLKAYKKSNLGSHSASMLLTDVDIRNIAQKAIYFVVLINEIISNPAIA